MLWILLLLGFISSGHGLSCYRCNSTHTLDCLEKFIKPNSLRPEPCSDIAEAQHCIKVTGFYQGVEGTQRFCSSRDLGNYCEYITRETDGREFRTCVYTCTGDGCNAAYSRHGSTVLTMLVIAVAILFALICRSWH